MSMLDSRGQGEGEAARELGREQLTMLLAGIDFWNAHRTLVVKKAG